ncbi:MAG: putative DNA-binding transcriptional activator of the family [Frankiales bacterium]|nr:putative DNA-binding transcriptional activator of the family [Frankiales bacterium]
MPLTTQLAGTLGSAAAAAPRVELLDGFAVGPGAGRPPVGELPRGVQRLVAHLCLTRRPARTAIAGELWPDVPEEHAQGSLRSALWRVHKAVPGLLDVSGGAVALAEGVRVDVQELSAWARRVLDPRGRLDDPVVPDAGLRSELLPGWYDDWVLLERERLRQLRMHALEAVAARLTAAGRHGEALQVAYAAVRAEPLRESAHRTVVRVHLGEGNVAEAVRAFHVYRALVEEELGVGPTEQMTGLVRDLGRLRRVGAGRGIPRPRDGAAMAR